MKRKLEEIVKALTPYEDFPVFDREGVLVVFHSANTLKSSKSHYNENWLCYSFTYLVTLESGRFGVEIAYDQVGDFEWNEEIKTSAKHEDLLKLALIVGIVVDCHERLKGEVKMEPAMTFNLGTYQVSFYTLKGKHCFVIERQGEEVFKEEIGFNHQNNAIRTALTLVDVMESEAQGKV